MTTKQAQHTSHPPFWPDEDQLVNLLLRDNPYTLFGGVSPQEALAWARAQSREMLAASDLLAACRDAYAFLDGNIGGIGVNAQEFQRRLDLSTHLRAAIAKTTEGQP